MLQWKSKPTVLNVLRDARLSRGLTESQLATLAGCEPATIVAIEDGEYTPSISLSLRLAWALGYPVEQLFWLPPEASSLGMRDERIASGFMIAYVWAYYSVFTALYVYLVLKKILDLPQLANPSMTVTGLYLLTSLLVGVYQINRWLVISKLWVKILLYTAWCGGILFSLAVLGDDIGLTTIQVIIALAAITAIPIWALAIREFVRNRHPVQYHESYGDG